ncbi:amino acid ABC transporter permease [Microbaculum marinisediminis]|uniref:Amino acid ABC transporter permease n=1 Tax=Microbaculum marinisediminis TaxID=2931392 RepID=A0AAW5R414_9HYPH|nr:amino acid ABC transporter permease [Microbaculum sp. A6E488]MCT8973887.1 amino acid ABC transporter permease [Microbaculum sp. A6E488]
MIELLHNHGGDILRGLFNTIAIVAIGFAAGAIAGTALAFPLGAKRAAVRLPVRCYVEAIRNTPFLIQAMLIFATVGVFRLRIDPQLAGVLAVAIYTSAYMAEIIRGALKSVPEGQWDAAAALGLRSLRRFRLIILPQLLPFALPACVNLVGTVAKESAFLSAVSVPELTFAGQVVIAQTFKVFEVWAIIGGLYLALVLVILAIARRLESRMAWLQPA